MENKILQNKYMGRCCELECSAEASEHSCSATPHYAFTKPSRVNKWERRDQVPKKGQVKV
jgi:hypothetical protein